MSYIWKVIKSISGYLDRIAGFVFLLIMAIVVANVLSRNIFGAPIAGTYDYVSILTSVAIGLALANCGVQRGHISVDFFVEKFPPKMKLLVDIITGILSTYFLLMASWKLVEFGHSIFTTGQKSPSAMIPYYPFVYIMAFGIFVLALVVIMQLISLVRKGVEE